MRIFTDKGDKIKHKFTIVGADYYNPKKPYKAKWHNWYVYCEKCNQNKAAYNRAKYHDFGKNVELQDFIIPNLDTEGYEAAKSKYQNAIKEFAGAKNCI